MTKLAFLIGYGAIALPALLKILSEESTEHNFNYIAVRDILASEYTDFIREADAILIYSSKLPEDVEDAIRNGCAKLIISLSDSYNHLMKADPEIFSKAVAYYKTGGRNNLRNLIHLILKELDFNVTIGDLEEVPWHGIFHPKLGYYNSTNEYLNNYQYASKPLVGLLFYRNYVVYEQLGYIEALINALESEDMGVIPVFTYGFKDPILNTPTAEDSIRKFFLINDKPAIDVIVDLTSFFLLNHGRWNEPSSQRFRVVSGIDLLKKLNVPIIRPVVSLSQSVNEWLKSDRGIDYLSQVYRVIMPEVDGLIEPIYIAGAQLDSYGAKSYQPYIPHTKYIAKRVKKWINLKRKPPSKRKLAFILNNPPCKNLEASIAVGFGLDVPESIVRLLHKLKEYGYNVGESIPKNGNELIKMFLDRRAISEFRWTSIEDIVRNGGAVDFVDANTYMKWFNELPINVREKMINDWGHPLDVLEGKISKELVGMVYNGKFVIPGIIFGNVFITTQPKFGCAGPACDGKVCKILHDPTITPPHQWLAVYRWITRIFKADVIIHFGTHGYLEFRPGKSIGLSPSCWPEISIDDTPHLYVYVVSNPMEGVIAKRRSYATIIDHMYPPMMMAEVMDEINSLLTQYHHAKQMEDYARAKIIYNELIEKAKKYNIPIKSKDEDKIVEEIHRYVSNVRGTQIEAGLHIFGNPPTNKLKIAEYIASAMAYDSHEIPSIRRVLAEFLGLNYDELRLKPNKNNKFGLTNAETLNLLHKLAIKVIFKLLEMNINSRNLNSKLLIQIINDEFNNLIGGVKYSRN